LAVLTLAVVALAVALRTGVPALMVALGVTSQPLEQLQVFLLLEVQRVRMMA